MCCATPSSSSSCLRPLLFTLTLAKGDTIVQCAWRDWCLPELEMGTWARIFNITFNVNNKLCLFSFIFIYIRAIIFHTQHNREETNIKLAAMAPYVNCC